MEAILDFWISRKRQKAPKLSQKQSKPIKENYYKPKTQAEIIFRHFRKKVSIFWKENCLGCHIKVNEHKVHGVWAKIKNVI